MIIRCHKTGKDAAGLTRYLFGPGKANEHTNQRMVAGSPELAGEWSGAALSMREATHLGRVVEASWRRQYAPELALAGVGAGGISRDGLHSNITERLADGRADGSVRFDLAAQQDHVFHASLSLHPDDPGLTDEQWNEVATKYVEEMGFTGVDGRPDCSWFAVHHGRSSRQLGDDGKKDPTHPGNDHIHIVVCVTRRDGSRVDLHNSGRRSQEVRRDVLEKLPYLTPLHESGRAANTPSPSSFTAAEHNMARDRAARGDGPATPDRVLLQRILRAAATDATTEAGFINNVIKNPRMEIAAARWKPGTDQQVVTGYKIRFKDGTWFSASTLAPDLTLSKLRPGWRSETDESREYARALWAEQAPGEKRVTTTDAPAQLDQAAVALAAVNDALADLDPAAVDAWNDVAAATAGTVAVVATAAPRGLDEHGRETGFSVDAGRASDVLTRQWLADNYNRQATSQAPPKVPAGLSNMELAARHIQLAVRATSTDRHQGWLAVLQQLMRTVNAIADAKAARGELVGALSLRRDAVTAMGRLEAWVGTRAADPGADAASTPVSGERGPELSEAARAAREASGHARGPAPQAPQPAPAAGEARVNRGPDGPKPGRSPRRG
ncbi:MULTISPECIES: relaxase/mobilization nuclease domain-containing protein [Pimelobacter]|uniref:relaxase/mobilization nuclease domain-containing protein n=1 Tax=Pimelobacter TaxID=2044 RepID=UPI001C040676|nr:MULTISPECIES: relaxase/mobilization nuclease domain-containing protein [Pimelobacter]MBU2698869.1 hypothetical protein [Pimelobacter sp. 30-1]UUW93002.1 relaxase/mobilization nuclease domain-containing protein [Pimelobacter simplex]UUW99035.1 relaxase/mobilization nuclease domain-containing protein [Pimelobacter simplex]